jgi:HPt (histidine-containing phosphotransfer) domain-containing protein
MCELINHDHQSLSPLNRCRGTRCYSRGGLGEREPPPLCDQRWMFAMDSLAELLADTTAERWGQSPVDHAHLARYTLGSRSLEIEVLRLFAEQAPVTLQELTAATSAKEWHAAAHTLKGSARAVGAHQVAKTAEIAEAAGHADPRRAELIGAVEAMIEEARSYISRL